MPITSGHVLLQGNNVNCTKIMSWYLCLQRRLSQLSEGIEIINRILPYCQSISAVANVLTLHSLQTEVEVVAANPSTQAVFVVKLLVQLNILLAVLIRRMRKSWSL